MKGANKHMVLTLPARDSFGIIARHKRFVATQPLSCRTGRRWAAHVRRYAVFSKGAKVRKEKRWNKNDIFPWGKHKGETLISVMVHDVRYITWCIENVAGFVLDNESYETYEAFADTPYLNSHLRRD